MDTVYRVACAAVRVLRSRLFSASVLAVVCAVIVAYVSLNMNAVTVMDGDTSRVVLTLDDNSNHALSDSVNQNNESNGSGQDSNEVQAIAGNADADDSGAFNVQITADGISRIVRMTGGTVAEAIQRVGVPVGKFDKISVDLDQQVSDGLSVQVDRIEYKDYTETKTVKYKTVVKYTATIVKGKSSIQQAGENGVDTLTYRKCYENGAVIGTELLKEEVTTAPVDEIKLVGTSTKLPLSEVPFDVPLDSKGQPLNYSAVYSGRATAYSSDHGNAGKYTASGRKAQVGVVAVNPNVIPYGTKLYIVSADGSYVYGYAIAGDTGTALMQGNALVDLYFNTYEECVQFGAKKMNVYVIG